MNRQTCKKTATPEWFTRGSIYQINPRTFSSEGTLRSVTEELPFLADLGFKVIYLCPIFREDDSPTGHSPRQIASGTKNPKNPYRMNDYFEIDPEYGNMDDLRELVDAAHRLGLKVMLDLVYLHIGPNADILKRNPDFAERDENGNTVLTRWNFPKLNYKNEGLKEYLWCNMTYYVGAIGVDGFRCDVGDEVPLDFWLEGRRRIRAISADAVMLNEGTDVSYLEEAFDASYCFDWHEIIYDTVRNGASARKIRECHEGMYIRAPQEALVMRDIDNHDTVTDWPERTEVAVGNGGMELIEMLNYFIDGVPMVYCGNELADTTELSMFANRFYRGRFTATDRGIKNDSRSIRRQQLIRRLNAFKFSSDTLCLGKTEWLENSDGDRVLSFARRYKDESIIFIGNFSKQPCSVKIDAPNEQMREMLFESETAPRFDGEPVSLPAFGYAIFKAQIIK